MAQHATKAHTDVGHILVQVQEDLKELKEKISHLTIQNEGEAVDIQSLETAIHRTEIGLKRHAAEYLNSINRQVLTLPAVEYRDLPAGCSLADAIQSANSKIIKKHEVYPSLRKKHQGPQLGNAPQHISPGIQHKLAMDMKILHDPTHPKNRSFLNENYGLQLPVIRSTVPEAPLQKLAKGTTVAPLTVLPSSHREDPSLLPPFVSEKDAKKGILSLTERGLIPPAAGLSLHPHPIQHKVAIMHDSQEKYRKPPPEIYGSYPQKSYYIVISETSTDEPDHRGMLNSRALLKRDTITPAPSMMTPLPTKDINAVQHLHDKQMVPCEFHEPKELQVVPVHQPQEFPQAYYVTILKGRIDYLAPDFLAFKQHYQLYWRHIFSFLEYLEMKLRKYSVPVAVVEGQRLAKISVAFDIDSQPTWEMLLPALKNKDLVEEIVKRPGQQYKGPDGMEIAATKIQAIWRQYRARTKYLVSLRQKWAAGVIAISWLMHAQKARVKKTLKQSRQRHLENFRSRAKHLAANWNRIKASRRTIIHIPSLGYAQWLRSTVPDIDTQQNLQMGRLCDIRDDNIDVIYICPLWIGEDVTQYYMKLLGLQEAVRLGKPEVMVDMADRLKVITPEATRHFPTHHLCLATHLKYSPQAIQRIKNLIEGKAAYIVGGLLHQDDLAVADMLNVPILGPEPEVAHLYSTKSGSKRIFASVSVPVPPGEYDIYNLQQMHEVLIQLILENLEIKRWLFKMDTEFGGRGTAYFDVSHLPCYHQTLKEFRKVGPSVWLKRRWMQEPSELKMAKELPGVLAEHARPVNQEMFPTWEKYLKMFLCQGGVVEAYPPSDSVTNLTIDMLIEPTGEISMVSCGDQIHSGSPLECWGTTVPQCSVDPSNLHSMCVKIAEACKCRGVLGFFSIDLVTFIHPYTMEQQVWATDLDLTYSDQLAMTQLMLFISNGKLTCAHNSFEVPPTPKEKKGRLHRQKVAKEVEMQTQLPFMKRYGVLSTQLKHANLSMVHYSVLFKIFKAHGIGFDIKERQGTVFVLHEGNKRDRLGMVTIGEDLQGALLTFARNLSVIHQEITAPNVHWENNFQAAIKDIEVILGVTIVNKSKEDRSAPPLKAMT
ncbi:IQ motif-containing protein H [Hemitrygon akajei]|uniref:IQ motif-containing protein H n=1 Tax=Hemitrygon akajei TaxID=2704970 RepID=UPI003BF972C9